MNIKRTLKRLIDDTHYVAALEKQNDLLKENLQQEKDNLQKQKEDFRKEKEQKVADEEAQYKKRSRNYLRPIADMQKWLLENYEFRYNVITDVFEYRKKTEHDFEIIDKYAINTIAIEVQEAGIFVRDHLEPLLLFGLSRSYEPSSGISLLSSFGFCVLTASGTLSSCSSLIFIGAKCLS